MLNRIQKEQDKLDRFSKITGLYSNQLEMQ
jgi:hypothetical protein